MERNDGGEQEHKVPRLLHAAYENAKADMVHSVVQRETQKLPWSCFFYFIARPFADVSL